MKPWVLEPSVKIRDLGHQKGKEERGLGKDSLSGMQSK
jgi:hypothetical protein